MKFRKLIVFDYVRQVVAAAMFLGCLAAPAAFGQAGSTASRGLEIAGFGGVSGVLTGLNGGRELAFTGGLDVGFRPFYGLLPAVEVRGMYPLASGTVDREKNVLAGLRIQKRHRGFRVYGDVLFGRGGLEYLNGGILDAAGDFRYLTSTTNVFSPGLGISQDVGYHLSVFADAQFQHYNTPVTAAGSLWSKPLTIGVTYRLPFLKHGHPY